MLPILRDKTLWLLLIFASLYILGNIGTGSLTTYDEATMANISREILNRSDWLVLYHGGGPWIDKPPLYMWCTAIWYALFGVNEFTTRVTSGIFGVATILLIYVFTKKIGGKNAAIFAALTLLALPHYLRFAKLGMLDVTVTFFITAAIYLFWIGQDKPRYLLFSGIAFALGYLTKGFAAVTAPIIIFTYCVFTNNVRILLRRQFVIGMLIAVILIGGWHLSQYLVLGQKAIDTFFGVGVYKRATSTFDGHSGGMNFYQKVIFNKNKPWAVLLYASFAYMVWLALRKRDRRAMLLCAWMVVMYTLYTIVQSKLHWYIMPVYPALAVSSGIFLDRFLKNKAFKIFVAVILLGMLIQVPVSWAFKLDFNAKAKDAALHSIKLPYEDDGTIFYNAVVEIRNKQTRLR